MRDSLLQPVVEDPLAEARWLVLADWLEEHDDPRRAELLRLHRRLLATCCEPDGHPERGEWQARVVELLAHGVKPCVPRKTVVLGEGVEMEFSFIPPGFFLMGSPDSEQGRDWGRGFEVDETRHPVTLSRGFWLGVRPVSRRQWRHVMGSKPRRFRGRDDCPANEVSWEDCGRLCLRLGEKTGQRFRLPTEAEWEWACRAGTTTPFFLGETISPDQAGYDPSGGSSAASPRRRMPPPRHFPPNAWGLYGMHGGVWEWCQDWYGPYPHAAVEDPRGPEGGEIRVLRGGSFDFLAVSCRSACRYGQPADFHYNDVGCRVVLCPG